MTAPLPEGMSHWRLNNIFWAEYVPINGVQVGASLPYIFRAIKNPEANLDSSFNGVGDPWIYGKVLLLQESHNVPAVATDLWLKLPLGDQDSGLGTGTTDMKAGLMISKRIRRISLHLNPEVMVGGLNESPQISRLTGNSLAVNMGLAVHGIKGFLPVIEGNGLWLGDSGHQIDVGGGVLVNLHSNAAIKLGATFPVAVDMPWSVTWAPWVKLAGWF